MTSIHHDAARQPPEALVTLLNKHSQSHVLDGWHQLDLSAQQSLINQIESIDFEQLRQLTATLGDRDTLKSQRASLAIAPTRLVPLPVTAEDKIERQAARETGQQALTAGRVGAILVAGGQGTRLGFDHAKGMFPIGPVSGHSLYRILAEQLLARSRAARQSIPLYIMTSRATDQETRDYFGEHNNFGLPEDSVFYFQQGNMPAVSAEPDAAGNHRLLLESRGQLFFSPDGHGGMLAALSKSGLLAHMQSTGIDSVYYHQVDNPTAVVCDPEFIGLHIRNQSEMSTKIVEKSHPHEPMGAVVEIKGSTRIIEYNELLDDLPTRVGSDGKLVFRAGSTAMHVFDTGFLARLIQDASSLPFHVARKHVPHINQAGQRVEPDSHSPPNGIKFERFIFDALPHAKNALVVEADRQREFNPVKNASGPDSPATSRAAIDRISREWLTRAGVVIDEGVTVEVGPLFANEETDLLEQSLPDRISSNTYLSQPTVPIQ